MIIGIHGKLEAGKTSLTSHFVAQGFKELLFADGLKGMICALLGCSRPQLEDHTFKNTEVPWLGITPRTLMQSLGTEWGRGVDEDLWVRRTMNEAGAYPNVVISDMRFPNEFEVVRRAGGRTIKIVRDIDRSGPQHQHPSETALDHLPDYAFDYRVENNGTLEDLKQAANYIIGNI